MTATLTAKALESTHRNCSQDPNFCPKLTSIVQKGEFQNYESAINSFREMLKLSNPHYDPKLLLEQFLSNPHFIENATISETREVLDLYNGSGSSANDKNFGGLKNRLKRPFIYRSNVDRISHPKGGRSYNIPDVGVKSWMSVTGLYSYVNPFDPTLWIAKIKRENPTWNSSEVEEFMEKTRNEASTRGSMMHEAIEYYLRHRTRFDLEKDCERYGKPYFKCIWNYLRYHVDAVVAIEPLVFMDLNQVLGTKDYDAGLLGYVDLVGIENDKVIIYDWKTADKPKREVYIENYKIQVSAYSAMFYQTYGIKIDEARIVVAIKGKSAPQVFTLNREEIGENLLKLLENYKKYLQMR